MKLGRFRLGPTGKGGGVGSALREAHDIHDMPECERMARLIEQMDAFAGTNFKKQKGEQA